MPFESKSGPDGLDVRVGLLQSEADIHFYPDQVGEAAKGGF